MPLLRLTYAWILYLYLTDSPPGSSIVFLPQYVNFLSVHRKFRLFFLLAPNLLPIFRGSDSLKLFEHLGKMGKIAAAKLQRDHTYRE